MDVRHYTAFGPASLWERVGACPSAAKGEGHDLRVSWEEPRTQGATPTRRHESETLDPEP